MLLLIFIALMLILTGIISFITNIKVNDLLIPGIQLTLTLYISIKIFVKAAEGIKTKP